MTDDDITAAVTQIRLAGHMEEGHYIGMDAMVPYVDTFTDLIRLYVALLGSLTEDYTAALHALWCQGTDNTPTHDEREAVYRQAREWEAAHR